MTQIFLPTKVLIEQDVIEKQKEAWVLGKTALLITGRRSAVLSGAQEDILAVLEAQGVHAHIFNEVENDPAYDTIEKAARMAREVKADFIIGIGGGSPLDAAKAIAVLAVNDLSADALFRHEFETALPIVAVPTTAGTGSEVTPYSVIYRADKGTKLSFGNALTFPKVALLDAKYTETLSANITIHTAIDAFTHSFEGFLANRATAYSDMIALEAIRRFGEVLGDLKTGEYSAELRAKLLYISLLGGIVITHTGVTIVHGMGYAYTVHYDIPHGQANGLLLDRYMTYLEEKECPKLADALSTLGYDHETLANELRTLLGPPPHLKVGQVSQFTTQTLLQKGSIQNTYGGLTEADIKTLWEKE